MEDTVITLTALLTVFANIAVVVFTAVALAARAGATGARDRLWDVTADVALPLAAIVTTTTMLASLYFSEVAHFVPCKLCWYQRIAMYPLAVILMVAVIRGDRGIRAYAIPLAVLGSLVSIYHYQLEWFPSQASLACSADAPCTVIWYREFGYITLAFQALSGFLLVIWLTWIAGQRREQGVV